MNGMPLIEHTHNHPTQNVYAPYPAGIPGTKGADIQFARSITSSTCNISNFTPSFNIYDPKTKQYIPYSIDSRKSNFKYFNK